MSRIACATINLKALTINLNRVKLAAPHAYVMAVIKANAYGHGMVRIAQALATVDAFGVASINEAIVLRAAGIDKRIIVLEGINTANDLKLVQQYDLDIVVHQIQQVEIIESTPQYNNGIKIWLKFDTGMHRLGFAPADVKSAYARLLECGVNEIIHLMSHLANADDRNDVTSNDQLERFHKIADGNPNPKSLANSAGILGWPDTHMDWVRPGIMLYGVPPFVEQQPEDMELRPVMTLSSALVAVKQLKKGDAIGYGGCWKCPQDMPVGVVSIGYGDGYPRSVPSGTSVLLNGERTPIVGRVSMDMLTIDLRQQPEAEIGAPVILWGEGLPVEEIATAAGTIGYELLCGVTQRVAYEYRDTV